MADLKDIVGKNREFTGVSGIKTSSGATTANRVNEEGRLRYNNTKDLLEFYTGQGWKSIDSPPVINQLKIDGKTDAFNFGSSVVVDSTRSGNASIELIGDFFESGSVVSFPSLGATVVPTSTTFNSITSITVSIPFSSFVFANQPYNAKVLNASGLFATGASLTVDSAAIFNNAENSVGQIYDSQRTSVSLDVAVAVDAQGDAVTYALTGGSLPSGLSLNTSSGLITGSSSAVGTTTDSTITVTATSTAAADGTTKGSISRQFIVRQLQPQTTQITSTAVGTYTVPTGLTTIDVLLVGCGGNGGGHHTGGGGGGGLVYRPALPVTPGAAIPHSLASAQSVSTNYSTRGDDSAFGPLTALTGGNGRTGGQSTYPPSSTSKDSPFVGGSGAGGCHSPNPTHGGNQGIQTSEAGDSGTYGFGNPGGNGSYPGPRATGGGGGGAGGAGGNGGGNGGNGGNGKAYSISGSSVTYAGGGGGGNHQGGSVGSGGPGGGGGNQQAGTNGLGGGGGGRIDSNNTGTSGGTGVIWISF